MSVWIDFDERLFNETRAAVERTVDALERPEARKELIEAANQGVVNALRRHFAEREREQPRSAGFPWFGQVYPKRYFWRGTRGTSLAERIAVKLASPSRLEGVVGVDSPALKHKLAATPPPITPKGGRRYLAIPASPAAARWDSPREQPEELSFAYRPTPEGRWLPCLVADSGRRLDVAWWLVRSVRTRRDPNALPRQADMTRAATAAVAAVVRRFFHGGPKGS